MKVAEGAHDEAVDVALTLAEAVELAKLERVIEAVDEATIDDKGARASCAVSESVTDDNTDESIHDVDELP